MLKCVKQNLLSPESLKRLRAELSVLANGADASPDQSHILAGLREKLCKLEREKELIGKNLARAVDDDAFELISQELQGVKQRIQVTRQEIEKVEVNQPVKAERSDEISQILGAIENLERLVNRSKAETLLGRQLIEKVNARIFFGFKDVKLKKRTVNKVAGGVVTFGDTPPPVELYDGRTDSASVKSAAKKKAAAKPNSDLSAGTGKSSRNESRDDKTAVELFLQGLADSNSCGPILLNKAREVRRPFVAETKDRRNIH